MVSAQQFSFSAIDHLGVVGRNITALTTAYTRLGFSPTVPVPLMGEKDGVPVPLGQDSAHLIFADSYVELTGVTSQDPGHHLAPWLARREGLHILALGSADAEASRAVLTDAGHDVAAVQNASRHVDYGSNHGDAQFHWFKIPDDMADEGFLCIVEQLTPNLVFQPPHQGHPNGAIGVFGVIAVADDADRVRSHYAQLPGASGTENHRVRFGRQYIDVFDGAALAQTYPAADNISGPALAGFALTVERVETTRSCLSDNGISMHESANGDIYISPGDGCGAMVVFVQA